MVLTAEQGEAVEVQDKMGDPEQEVVEKTEDKKKIEEEEKMLNEENKKLTEVVVVEEDEEKKEGEKAKEAEVSTGEVERKRKALEEATKKDDIGKGRIPIGGIRMPGFLQRRSKDKSKSEPDPEEGVDLLEDPKAAKHGDGEGDNPGPAGSRLERLRRMLPDLRSVRNVQLGHLASVSLFTGRKRDNKDVEAQVAADTQATQATQGQSPVEEKDKEKEKENKAPGDTEDGMETVQLEAGAEEKGDSAKQGTSGTPDTDPGLDIPYSWFSYDHKVAVCGFAVFLILFSLIIYFLCVGGTYDYARGPIPDHQDPNGLYAIASTSCGPIQGVLDNGAYTFHGVPYAQPPVGKLRWKAAQPLNNLEHCWKGTLKAQNSSKFCWQVFPDDQFMMNGSEDCLYLDVYTPQVSFENLLPVVVVVGSSHMIGGSTTPLLQPTAKLARAKEVVFVRPNFRLGVLGFLSASALSRSTHPQTSGNYGLSDIKMALEWVQQNIEAFGGDPKAVTVLGYRAGATLVTALTAAPSAEKLMKRVWVTSGSADFPGRTLAESESDAAPFLSRLQCNETASAIASGATAECLRGLEAEDLLDSMPQEWMPTAPNLPSPPQTTAPPTHQWLVMDGDILRGHPSDVWANWEREGSPIKFVIGATAHADATVELFRNVSEGDKATIEAHVRSSALGQLGLAEEALRRYNASWPGLASLVSDLLTVCPLNTLATKMPSFAYFYVATFPISVSKSEAELEYPEPLAELGIDVAAIMGRVEGATPEERRYITAMQQLFYQFVRFGELHHASESYNGRVLVVDQDTLPKNEYPNCNFWIHNDAVPRFGHRN